MATDPSASGTEPPFRQTIAKKIDSLFSECELTSLPYTPFSCVHGHVVVANRKYYGTTQVLARLRGYGVKLIREVLKILSQNEGDATTIFCANGVSRSFYSLRQDTC